MKIFVLIGPPAAGKSILMDYLLLHDSDFMTPIISFTTRSPRPDEKEGKNYYFIDRNKYLQWCINGSILEEVNYLDQIYGLTHEEISRVKETGKNGIIIMTLEGLRMLKARLGVRNIVSIYIYRDMKDIIKAIESGNEDREKKAARIEKAYQEVLDISASDYVIYNIGSLDDAYRQLLSIIRKEINAPPFNLDIKPGQRYRHFKGNIYEIITIALHTENYCPLVIYKDLESGRDYARPYEIFCGKKELTKENRIVNRFELIREEDGADS